MVETVTEEKVPLEAKNKPFMVCGFLGVFWNLSYGPEDHLGSTRMVLNEYGEVKEALMYQPYGTVSDVQGISGSRTDPLRQKFTTKEFDEEGDAGGAPGIGTYYFGARMYDPDIGRFLSPDPKSQFHDSYNYCNGNPVNSIDPDGQEMISAWKESFKAFAQSSLIANSTMSASSKAMSFASLATNLATPAKTFAQTALSFLQSADLFLGSLVPQQIHDFAAEFNNVLVNGLDIIDQITTPLLPHTAGGGWFALDDAIAATARSGSGLVKTMGRGIGTRMVTLAGESTLAKAVANPMLTRREAIRMSLTNSSGIRAAMKGKGIDRAFREYAMENWVLKGAGKFGLIQINPMNRGADMVGKGILEGIWWDVTTLGSWGTHVQKYGAGGIGLFY